MIARQIRLAFAAVDDQRIGLFFQFRSVELHIGRESRAAHADDAAARRDGCDIRRAQRINIVARLHGLVPAILKVVVDHDSGNALSARHGAGGNRHNLAGNGRMNRRGNESLSLSDDLAHVYRLTHLHAAHRRCAGVLSHRNRHTSRGGRVHDLLGLGCILAIANLAGMDASAKCLGSSHRQVPPFAFQDDVSETCHGLE